MKKSNLGPLDHMINDNGTIVSINVGLMRSVTFNSTSPLLLSTPVLFNPQIASPGVVVVFLATGSCNVTKL